MSDRWRMFEVVVQLREVPDELDMERVGDVLLGEISAHVRVRDPEILGDSYARFPEISEVRFDEDRAAGVVAVEFLWKASSGVGLLGRVGQRAETAVVDAFEVAMGSPTLGQKAPPVVSVSVAELLSEEPS